MRNSRRICNILERDCKDLEVKRLDLLNKDREYQAFEVGQIVKCTKLEVVLLKLVVEKSNAIT